MKLTTKELLGAGIGGESFNNSPARLRLQDVAEAEICGDGQPW